MSRITATDLAYYFLQNKMDTPRKTRDGNMKLQKLLYFSQLIHLAKYGEPLFNDPILAYKNGSVVKSILFDYQYHSDWLLKNAADHKLHFDDQVKETIQIATDIFGSVPAKELSDLNHMHHSWVEAFRKSKSPDGGYDQTLNTITVESLMEHEVASIRNMISAYESEERLTHYEVVNGVKFFYDPSQIELNEELYDLLDDFDGDEAAYTIVYDEHVGVVIY